jgi:hypothetical protein
LGSERRATNPDEKNMLEAFSISGGDFSGMNIRRKAFDVFDRFFDLCTKFRVWRQRRIAQPSEPGWPSRCDSQRKRRCQALGSCGSECGPSTAMGASGVALCK